MKNLIFIIQSFSMVFPRVQCLDNYHLCHHPRASRWTTQLNTIIYILKAFNENDSNLLNLLVLCLLGRYKVLCLHINELFGQEKCVIVHKRSQLYLRFRSTLSNLFMFINVFSARTPCPQSYQRVWVLILW